jgi:hypothetical protein
MTTLHGNGLQYLKTNGLIEKGIHKMADIRRWRIRSQFVGDDGWTHPAVVSGPPTPHDASFVEVVPASQLEGAVSLTDEERERVLWWLRQPVPPGPMKELDERILQKFAHPSRGR